jgi:hypothetical protein
MKQVIGHRVDDRAGHLCAARAIQIGDRMTAMNSLERREGSADVLRGKDGKPVSGSSNGGHVSVLGMMSPAVSSIALARLGLASERALREDYLVGS